MIVALAGRRVDAVDAQERFAATTANVEIVRRRIRAFLNDQAATVLVSSAACGADLLALSEASRMGLLCRIVLLFNREKFRATSVTDRPGNWGSLYDEIVSDVQRKGNLVVIQPSSEDTAYLEANHSIIEEALALRAKLQRPVIAVLVWEGQSRGEGDLTAEFGTYAQTKGIFVANVMTR